jgi:AtzE family amidohydrolase
MSEAGVTSDPVSKRSPSVVSEIEHTLGRIEARNLALNAFTRILADDALEAALEARAGPLTGLSFAVKDLFDLKGHTTTAGAKMRLDAPVATEDAEAVRRLKAAGAICVGTLNMDEYAYGFATVNAHFGTTRNPHDTGRLAGGSSGGSAAAVAAGLVDVALGSDTNGSVRVPASLCGVWGLRPSEGLIPLEGVFPFVERFDRVGPFTRTSGLMARVFAVLADQLVPQPVARKGLRIARLSGFFARNASEDAIAALDQVCAGLGGVDTIDIEGAEAARSAAFLITAAEGGAFHLEALRERVMDYDPAVRDRLLAGALMPAGLYQRALGYLETFKAEMAEIFEDYDVLLAPATPITAPRLEDTTMLIDGQPGAVRANLGIYAQAITLSGLPVVSAPVNRPGLLPMGIQMIGKWDSDAALIGLAQSLESEGLLAFSPPSQYVGED